MDTPLLQIKLHIPRSRPGQRVARPRLIEKLNQGVQHKLVLVCAPAGFGKTTLVTEWLQQADQPCVWVSLDADDNDPYRFFSYLAAGVRQIEGVGQSILGLLQWPQPAPPKSLAIALLNDVTAIPSPFVLQNCGFTVAGRHPHWASRWSPAGKI